MAGGVGGLGGVPRWRPPKMAALRRQNPIDDPITGPSRALAGGSPWPGTPAVPWPLAGAAAGQYRLRGALAVVHSHAAPRRDATGLVLPRPLRLEAGAAPGGRR